MQKLKLACLASILAVGMAQAASAGTPCNGFEVKVKNKSPQDFVVHNIQLIGAEIQPAGIEKLNAHSELVFSVSNSKPKTKMKGVLEFHSISLPTQKVYIEYTLQNKHLVCHHDDKVSTGDYPVGKTRLPGHVTYTIG